MKKLNAQAISEAIAKIVSLLGCDVLKAVNINKFQSAINDLMPGMIFEVEKQTLLQCIRIGVGDKFIQAVNKTGEEQQRIIASINKTLTEDYAFPKDRADCVIDAFTQVLKIKISLEVSQYNENKIDIKTQPDVIKKTSDNKDSASPPYEIDLDVIYIKKFLTFVIVLLVFGFLSTSISVLIHSCKSDSFCLALIAFVLFVVPLFIPVVLAQLLVSPIVCCMKKRGVDTSGCFMSSVIMLLVILLIFSLEAFCCLLPPYLFVK